jgi:DNA-binding IclR family transcriptional regulator
LRVLELFDELQREARVSEIADRLAFPQSSTSLLLKCLEQLGYLTYDPETRAYLPSPRVALLGTWLDSGPVRNGALHRMLEELSRKTGDTVILAARNGIYSQYIHVAQAPSAMRFHVPPGSRRLVTWSATGFALLAGTPEHEIRSLCVRTNAEAPDRQVRIEVSRVLENVKQAREQGYFFSRGLVTPGAGSIAIPLLSGVDIHQRPLAVAVSGLLDGFVRREKAIVRSLVEAASRYLGVSVSATVRRNPRRLRTVQRS